MNKKTNTLIFMVAATVVNILLLCIFFVIGLVILTLLSAAFPESGLIPVIMVIVFVGVIVLSFFVYSKLAKWVINKFDLEEKMDPIFSNKNNRRNRMD